MSDSEQGRRPLPPNFLLYDHDSPSPLFPPQKVAYIESIAPFFSDAEFRKILDFERFALNLNTNMMSVEGIPGLRKREGEGLSYVKRFSDEPWKQFVGSFLSHIPGDFPDRGRCINTLFRITLPSQEKYYPFTFFGDLDKWRDLIKAAAGQCGTSLGNFDRGKFVTDDGVSYALSELKMDQIAPKAGIPDDW